MFSFFFHGTVPRMGRGQESSLDDYGKRLKKVYSTSVNGILGWDFKPQRLSAAVRENKKDLYLELFRRYTDFFCPPNGSPSPAASMTIYSTSNPPSTAITFSSGGGSNTGGSAISQLNIRFLAIMNEFWLNQNPLPSKTKKEIPVSVSNEFLLTLPHSSSFYYFTSTLLSTGLISLLPHYQTQVTYTCPTRQVVIGIQVLIQRLISNYSASPSLYFTQELLLIQKSLYWFLRLAFAHWPLATPIYPVVDFWLAYLSLKKLPR
jgi:hypothetical protein